MLTERCWKMLLALKCVLRNNVTVGAHKAGLAVKYCIYCTWFARWNPSVQINVCDELHYLAMLHVHQCSTAPSTVGFITLAPWSVNWYLYRQLQGDVYHGSKLSSEKKWMYIKWLCLWWEHVLITENHSDRVEALLFGVVMENAITLWRYDLTSASNFMSILSIRKKTRLVKIRASAFYYIPVLSQC